MLCLRRFLRSLNMHIVTSSRIFQVAVLACPFQHVPRWQVREGMQRTNLISAFSSSRDLDSDPFRIFLAYGVTQRSPIRSGSTEASSETLCEACHDLKICISLLDLAISCSSLSEAGVHCCQLSELLVSRSDNNLYLSSMKKSIYKVSRSSCRGRLRRQ